MSTLRRAAVVLAAVGSLGLAALLQTAAAEEKAKLDQAKKAAAEEAKAAAEKGANAAQKVAPRAAVAPPVPGMGVKPGADPSKDTSFADGLSLPTDRKARQAIQLARDFIDEKDWGNAANVLQSLLEKKEDLFVEIKRKGPDGKETSVWTSVRTEANRLIGSMPPEGLDVYELRYGAKARSLLAKAKTENDPRTLAEVAQKYLHTKAGAEGTDLLGTYFLDRGGNVMAALCFERLLGHPQADKLSPLVLLKAALAFRRNGDRASAAKAWDRLAQVAQGGLRLGDRNVSLGDLRQELDRVTVEPTATALFEWPMLRGNPSRTAQGVGGPPYLDDPTWRVDTAKESQTNLWIDGAIRAQNTARQPTIGGYCPITAVAPGDKGPVPIVIYRTYKGVQARGLKDGEIYWDSPSAGAIDSVLADPSKASFMTMNNNGMGGGGWVAGYLQGQSMSLLFENSSLGTLSSDGARVYLVDDLALPPHPLYIQQFGGWGGAPTYGSLADLVQHNKLQAIDIETGKLVWELGGAGDAGDLAGTFFLGPPLPLAGKLYVLNERKSELRLVCLDPPRGDRTTPVVAWTQTLANARADLVQDPGRRMQAAPLAYGEGVLVCPTNAGAVLGVDLLTHSLVWARSYRGGAGAEHAPNQGAVWAGGRRVMVAGGMGMMGGNLQLMSPDWKACTPVIAEGRVVFTAPDGNQVHCLNLRDGTPVWATPRGEDLYLAGVYSGKVVLVGKSGARALSLADGRPLWRVETGLPSGQGVASKGVYYLPLKAGSQSKAPEVCAIDIDRGTVVGRAQVRKKGDAKPEPPGNLVFFDGDVVSQTPKAVAVYPQLEVKLAQIDERLRNNPHDPVGLAERGEMRLDKGDLDGAVADLHTALASKPPAEIVPKAKSKLFETLTELLKRDFPRNEGYLDEYQALCKVDVPDDADPEKRQKLQEDGQKRLATFLALKAKGRERQGRLADAFDAYLEFGALSGYKDLVGVVDDPALRARPDVWARGRIAAMFAHARPEQRAPLEQRVGAQWDALRATADLEALRRFVRVFSLFPEGKEARLRLAERLLEDKEAFLEAELNLQQLRHEDDPHLAARAVEALARLMIRKGLLEDAAYYYRLLGTRFADVPVRDGKTGADFFNELATDKRFLPYLDEPRQVWSGGKIRVRDTYSGFNQWQPQVAFEPEGEALPYFQRLRVSLIGSQLRLTDRLTGEERWSHELPDAKNNNNNQLNNFGWQPQVRYTYRVEGHLMVLSVGPLVYGLDPIGQKVLWHKDLLETQLGAGPQQIMPNGQGGMVAVFPNGFALQLGQGGPVAPSYVCLHNDQGVSALEPLSGAVLWARAEVGPYSRLFGDPEHIFLVDARDPSSPGTGRVLRAADGLAEEAPDFALLYQKRIRVQGRTLLLSETDPQGVLTLRLYDVVTGKDRWRKAFSAKARVVRSDDDNLAGVIEPERGARVTVFDVTTQKEVLVTRVRPEDARSLERMPEDAVHGVHLVTDDDLFYLVFNGPQQMNMNSWVSVQGMRTLSVNGNVYAFEKATGKLRWRDEVPDQMLILERFADVPILIFTGRMVNRQMGGRAGAMMFVQSMTTQSIDKRTGKLLYYKENQNAGNQFFALNVDAKAKTVELVGYNQKLVHYLEPEAGGKKK